jgi:hypothetical protein
VAGRELLLSLHPVTLGVVFSLLAVSLGAQEPDPGGAAGVQLRVETDQASYQVGDSIMVRLTLQNISDRPIRFQYGTYTGLVDLKVMDQAGRVIQPTVTRLGAKFSGPLRTLRAGGAMTLLHWKAPPVREWLNLRDWGYEIRTPGRYKIVGSSAIGRAQSNRAQMSNGAIIRLER